MKLCAMPNDDAMPDDPVYSGGSPDEKYWNLLLFFLHRRKHDDSLLARVMSGYGRFPSPCDVLLCTLSILAASQGGGWGDLIFFGRLLPCSWSVVLKKSRVFNPTYKLPAISCTIRRPTNQGTKATITAQRI